MDPQAELRQADAMPKCVHCFRPSVTARDNVPYCEVHDPVGVEQRRLCKDMQHLSEQKAQLSDPHYLVYTFRQNAKRQDALEDLRRVVEHAVRQGALRDKTIDTLLTQLERVEVDIQADQANRKASLQQSIDYLRGKLQEGGGS